jgi:hypothetical protein
MLPSKSAPAGSTPAPGRAKLPNSPRARLPWLFSPVRWFREQLRRPLRIERRGIHLHILLGEPAPAPAPELPEAGSGIRLRQAHCDLRALLGRHPEAARLLPHLAFIERALRKNGSSAIPDLPLSVLHRGLAQLNSVAHGEPGEGLAELRRRLGLAIAARTRAPGAGLSAQGETEADRNIDVSEASHSLFEEMERSWTGQVPQGN